MPAYVVGHGWGMRIGPIQAAGAASAEWPNLCQNQNVHFLVDKGPEKIEKHERTARCLPQFTKHAQVLRPHAHPHLVPALS